jgi:hypothetical protein
VCCRLTILQSASLAFHLVISTYLLSRIYELPTTVTLDILTARRAQRILNSRYEVLIFTRAKTSDRYHLLPLEESSWLELQGQAQNAFYQPQRATRAIGPLITSTSPPSYV